MKADIAKDDDFDPADAVDAQKRALLTIAEGYDPDSNLTKLIRDMILFHSRYKIFKGPSAHQSATCIVVFAVFYHGIKTQEDEKVAESTEVALKFMKDKTQFERELSIRKNQKLDPKFMIEVMHYHPDCIKFEDDEAKFKRSIVESKKGLFKEYPYCIVLPRATRGLQDMITHDHIAGVPERLHIVTAIAHQIADALAHLCEKGVIHGDLVSIIFGVDSIFAEYSHSSAETT
jgi:hypothetical protein